MVITIVKPDEEIRNECKNLLNQTVDIDWLKIFYHSFIKWDKRDGNYPNVNTHTKEIDLAKNYGVDIVKQKVQKDTLEAFKQAIGQNTIFDVAQNQEKIRSQVKKMTNEKIGEYPVVIDDIKISNYDWSEEFDNQIASTMKIAQEAKQQEQQLKKVEIEAQQAVKKAEANKEAERLNAEAMELKGKGVKAYNDAITSNQRNMELEIELKKLEIEKILSSKKSQWPQKN